MDISNAAKLTAGNIMDLISVPIISGQSEYETRKKTSDSIAEMVQYAIKVSLPKDNDKPVSPTDSIIDSNVLLKDMQEIFGKCFETAVRKNHDYAGQKPEDCYKNFSNSTLLGVSVQHGIMVRMMDKFMRTSNLLSQENAVKDESIQDTIHDLINYAAILSSTIKQKI